MIPFTFSFLHRHVSISRVSTIAGDYELFANIMFHFGNCNVVLLDFLVEFVLELPNLAPFLLVRQFLFLRDYPIWPPRGQLTQKPTWEDELYTLL